MDRAFSSGSSASPPTAPASPSIGYATAGNPGTGTAATKPGPYWYHMMTEEMRGVLVAAGLTPSQGDVTQLLQALPAALASRPEMARSLTANGYQKLPGGLIFQWGTDSTNNAGPVTVTFPIAFPNNCFTVFDQASKAAAAAYTSVSDKALANFTLYKSDAVFGSLWFAIGN